MHDRDIIRAGDRRAAAVSTYALPQARWPVLVSVPHSGRTCPPQIRGEARVPVAQLGRLSDAWCDIIAAPLLARGAVVVKADLLRAVADCNRHEADMDPVDVELALRPQFGPPGRKARAGLGVVPARLPGVGPLWARPVSAASFAARLDMLHRPFHQALAQQVDALGGQFGQILLIDLHSMPPLPVSRNDPHPARIVIGDRFGRTAQPGVARLFTASLPPTAGCAAANIPYAGGHIVETHGRPAHGVHAIQVEFDRRLYLAPDGCANPDRALELGEWLADRADAALDLLARDVQIAAE